MISPSEDRHVVGAEQLIKDLRASLAAANARAEKAEVALRVCVEVLAAMDMPPRWNSIRMPSEEALDEARTARDAAREVLGGSDG